LSITMISLLASHTNFITAFFGSPCPNLALQNVDHNFCLPFGLQSAI
jgi:hypothetical protein